jgi:(p)ppGpp synthase/HD superfamily hydrolase
MLDKAWQAAVAYHGDQMYGGRPYAWHLVQVANSLDAYSAEHIAVAYLHDILEDTAYTEEDLRMTFPQDVADAVVAMTKVDGEEYGDYIQKVIDNDIAHVVKMYDTICNLQESLNTQQWRRVLKYSSQLAMLARHK